ncbi:MAG: hypothetical protein RLZZ303_3534 [Candidatus Hydrogenedentota bacterium]|jgi:oxepin-CoA hydrolase/3-oxo-5,6-dehydrosuberyl-CoA semialdehyde dehydrogenase
MPALDRAMVDKICDRLSSLPEDVKPQWGNMTLGQMRAHMKAVLLSTMGEGPDGGFHGNWMTRHLFRRLVLSGLVEIPHNVKLPREARARVIDIPSISNEELRDALNLYLEKLERGELKPRTHPFFGLLSPREWQRFHAAHFKHHMKQFGAWD